MKVKLIYKDDTDKYFIRYSNGKSKIVKLNEAYHLAEENKIGIGESETIESKEIKLDWTDGTPPPPTREEYHKQYFIKNRERIMAYQRERYAKKIRLTKL
jgi:hypothetical protein